MFAQFTIFWLHLRFLLPPMLTMTRTGCPYEYHPLKTMNAKKPTC